MVRYEGVVDVHHAFTVLEVPAVALTLNDLKQVLQPLTNLGKGEDSFDIEQEGQPSLRIVMRSLRPEEELQVQRYARGALTEGDANDQMNAMEYLDRFRASCLGFAIVQIGDLDLRNVDTVETGEKLPNGVAVKIKRHEAVQMVVGNWSRAMTTAVFQRYNDLNERIESQVSKSIKYDDDHIDAEIARLEERLSQLKSSKAKTTAGANDLRSSTMDLAANKNPEASSETSTEKPEDQAPTKPTWETAVANRTTEEAPAFVAIPSDVPRSLEGTEPTQASAPVTTDPAPSQRKPVFGARPPVRGTPAQPPPPPQEPARKPEDPNDPLSDVRSSFVDTSDPDAIAEENRRIMEERRKRAAPPPPHLSAREVSQTLLEAPSPSAGPVGAIGGVPVFQRPPETLDPSTKAPQGRTPQPPPPSNTNPKFKPAK